MTTDYDLLIFEMLFPFFVRKSGSEFKDLRCFQAKEEREAKQVKVPLKTNALNKLLATGIQLMLLPV